MEIENVGMVNSMMYFDRDTKKFDVEKAFKERCTNINNASEDIKHLVENAEDYTEEEVKRIAVRLANQFFTLVSVASSIEGKKFKK